MRRFRTLVAAALVLGVVGGSVAALLIPEHSSGQRAARPQPIALLPPLEPVRDPGLVQLVPEPGTMKVEVRRSDPRGGLPFAVRVFRARRLALALGSKDLAKGRLLGHPLCAQLGRVYRGEFGWLDGQNRFRPATADYVSTPIVCGDRWRDGRSRPELSLTTLISNPLRASARPLQSIAWGIAGSAASSVEIAGLPGGEASPALSARGAFLSFASPRARLPGPRATITYRGRPSFTQQFGGPFGFPPAGPHGRPGLRIVPGSESIETRAPDPAGGLPWGLVAGRTQAGAWCPSTQVARIVGNRVGEVYFGLGTFSDGPPFTQCFDPTSLLTRDRPVSIGTGGEGDIPDRLNPNAEPQNGRTELRTLPGRSWVTGVARPDVREITIESPRDVRTVIPSRRAHTFLVVYDGMFPTGDFVVTATLEDGTHKTLKVPAGM